jgi:chromosomal replication initiator protein
MNVIWEKTLEILEKSINPTQVRAWILPLQVELDATGMTLTAANGFVASWIKTHYADSIAQALQQAAARELSLRIVSKPCPQAQEKCTAARRLEKQYLPLALPVPTHSADRTLSNQARWRFSFQDFVVGPCNELAFSAARSICRRQLVTDQCYICSAPGLGKTHLLQAMGQELSTNGNGNSPARVAYLSAEEFACRMIIALKRREMETFKSGFRDAVDVLLLEDIHFLQGKEKTQEELLATVKALRAAGKKVIFSSSFLPKELPKLDSQLASQFCDGFMAVINRPDFETRVRILEAKAKSHQVQIPRDVTELFAHSIQTDVRLLESCLQNLVIKARLLNQEISHSLALEILQNYAPSLTRPDLERITRFICQSFNLSHDKLRAKTRKKENVLARNAIFYLARKHTDLSLKKIGEAFNRKHSTVLKGITQVEQEIARQSPAGRQFDRLAQTLETHA